MLSPFFLADSEAARSLSRPLPRQISACATQCTAASAGLHAAPVAIHFCNKKKTLFKDLSAILIDFRTQTAVDLRSWPLLRDRHARVRGPIVSDRCTNWAPAVTPLMKLIYLIFKSLYRQNKLN